MSGMARRRALLLLAGLGGLALSACATGTAQGPAAPTPPPLRQACAPASEAAWQAADAGCREAMALELAEKAAGQAAWSEAQRWAQRALESGPESGRPETLFLLAEASYALGVTEGAEQDLEAALALGLAPERAARARYYLAEQAFLRKDGPAVASQVAALMLLPDSRWRGAGEALLGVAAREGWLADESLADLPDSLRALTRYVEAERHYQAGRYAEARPLYQAVAADPEAVRLGLRSLADGRLADLGETAEATAGRVGVVLPFSGRAGAFGWYVVRGVLLALDPFEDSRVDLRFEDTRGEPFRASLAVRALYREGAVAVIGPLIGKNAVAAVETANHLGMPTIVLSTGDLPRLAPWAIRDAVTPAQQVNTLLDESMGRRGHRRFAILHPDDPFGRGMMNAFWDAVLARGGEITGVESYVPGSTTFKMPIRAMTGADSFTPEEVEARKELRQPLAHLDFDAVFVPDGAATAALILPQLLYFDVRGPVFMGPLTWNHPQLLELGRNYAEGTLFVDWYIPGEGATPFAQTFQERYAKTFREARAPTVTAQGYEAGWLLRDGLGLTNRRALRDSLYGREWIGFSGEARIGADGEFERPLFPLTVRRKQIVPLKD